MSHLLAPGRIVNCVKTQNCQLQQTRIKHVNRKEAHLQFTVVMNSFLLALVYRIINLHNCSLVTTSVAVVRRGEDRDNLSVVLPLVTLHNKLVST